LEIYTEKGKRDCQWHVQSKIPSLLDCQPTDIGTTGYARAITVYPDTLFGNVDMWFSQPPPDVAGALGNFRLDVVISGTLQKKNSSLINLKTATNLNIQTIVLDLFQLGKGKSAEVKINGGISRSSG